MQKKKNYAGKLYLIPNLLNENNTPSDFIPNSVLQVISKLDTYIVEDLRTARRFLSKTKVAKAIDDIKFVELNKHTELREISKFLDLLKDKDVGIISEAGCPSIADPGANVVALAHDNDIKVIPLVGPSSILLSMMASGMNGQSFAFHGYLPIEKRDKTYKIKELETLAKKHQQAQIFIEAPYRNDKLYHDIIETCHPDTKLCISSNLHDKKQFIKTKTIRDWKAGNFVSLHKIPTVFIIGL